MCYTENLIFFSVSYLICFRCAFLKSVYWGKEFAWQSRKEVNVLPLGWKARPDHLGFQIFSLHFFSLKNKPLLCGPCVGSYMWGWKEGQLVLYVSVYSPVFSFAFLTIARSRIYLSVCLFIYYCLGYFRGNGLLYQHHLFFLYFSRGFLCRDKLLFTPLSLPFKNLSKKFVCYSLYTSVLIPFNF